MAVAIKLPVPAGVPGLPQCAAADEMARAVGLILGLAQCAQEPNRESLRHFFWTLRSLSEAENGSETGARPQRAGLDHVEILFRRLRQCSARA